MVPNNGGWRRGCNRGVRMTASLHPHPHTASGTEPLPISIPQYPADARDRRFRLQSSSPEATDVCLVWWNFVTDDEWRSSLYPAWQENSRPRLGPAQRMAGRNIVRFRNCSSAVYYRAHSHDTSLFGRVLSSTGRVYLPRLRRRVRHSRNAGCPHHSRDRTPLAGSGSRFASR